MIEGHLLRYLRKIVPSTYWEVRLKSWLNLWRVTSDTEVMDPLNLANLLNNNGKPKRRQVPRRSYEASVGVLYRGEYLIEKIYQVSEGGLMLGSSRPLNVDDMIVVIFKVPNSKIFIARGILRSVVQPVGRFPVRYGIEFLSLEFSARREIRNFVAAATSLESQTSGAI